MPELEAVGFDPFKSKATPEDFAARYGSAAEKAGKALGVDPSILLGQWGLETGWGKSVIPGTNNLGNIKDFAGGGVAATDNMTGSRDKYRQYATPDAFVDDFVSLIQRKYPNAVGAGSDPSKFTAGLKGYAEDPRYADKVAQATRMASNRKGPIAQTLDKVTDAVMPTAQAATLEPVAGPSLEAVDFDPFAKPKKQERGIGSKVAGAVLGALNPAAAIADTLTGGQSSVDTVAGLARGAGSIGATLVAPYDMAMDAIKGDRNSGISSLVTGQKPLSRNQERRQAMDNALRDMGADTGSVAYGAGKLGAEIAGTAGVGNALAIPVRAAGAPALANAIASGGMTTGAAPAQGIAQGAKNLLLRSAGGAINGGVSAGLVNPEDAATGAVIGGALPVATKAIGTVGNALGRAVSGGQMTPEVQALAQRAKELGIDIPADRLVNSKPLNALAASLDYVPGSGRAATMSKMEDQLNTAVSRTFGQDSSNVTQALRKAQTDLGGKFDTVLKNNTVKVDQQFLSDLADAGNMASKELGADGAKIISNQIDEIVSKAATGQIDGQAAYNIKRTLDRISNRATPEAFYARDLKQKLMAALDRSLGPQEAAAFANVRQQYGNMLALENIAQNGAEGGISIARLANMKNINNPELQELADISAQFLKSREGAHGAAQRAFTGAGAAVLGASTGTLPALAAGVATGRGANMLLNSGVVKNRLMYGPTGKLIGDPEAAQLLYRSAPVLAADR